MATNTLLGLDHAAKVYAGIITNPQYFIGTSSDNITEANTLTALTNENTGSGFTRDIASESAGINGQVFHTITFTNTGATNVTIRSIGLFSDVSGSTLLYIHTLAAPVTIIPNAGETIQIPKTFTG